MTPTSHSASTAHTIEREDLLLILHAALAAGSLRFLRLAALTWLTRFPGDLEVNLLLAKGLSAEGKKAQAEQILARLVRLDAEFSTARQLLEPDADPRLDAWQRLLRRIRRLLNEDRLDDARQIVTQAVEHEPESFWSALLQAQLAAAERDYRRALELTTTFQDRWPDSLHFALLRAEALLESGDETAAVELLHRCVVNDPAAQVPAHLWGESFAYRPLWPDPLAISFDLPIPADVTARLGWNLLPAVTSAPTTEAPADGPQDEMPQAEPEPERFFRVAELPPEDFYAQPGDEQQAVTTGADEEEQILPYLEQLLSVQEASGEADECADVEESPLPSLACFRRPAEMPGNPAGTAAAKTTQPQNQPMDEVQQAFERVAKRLKQPQLSRGDGRFPAYVIFSTRTGLAAQYGESTLGVLDQEMHRLADQVRCRQGWDALVFYADDADACAKYDLQPADPTDPWKLKLALADLDAALARKGEMIGALLIVGGSQVVPYHLLPNPTDDMDTQIASDNPYAVLDGNYFIPDWPVGRLPGEGGPDAGLLLETLRRAVKYHNKINARKPRKAAGFWQRARLFLEARRARKQNGSLGYSAAVWRRSSLAVYKSIGPAGSLLVSPPQETGCLPPVKGAISLAYYNLHGLVDAAEWYGQRDAADKATGPDYPVALSPKDLNGRAAAPEVVFSEACYGAHVESKSIDQSIALKFLARGSLAVVGSTSTAYGSVTTPLIGADFLGQSFWKSLKAGKSVGESLLQARVDLVREMSRRQGYLDGEDQKTLISFILLGDPLAGVEPVPAQSKSLLRARAHPVIKTISDSSEEDLAPRPVPEPVLKQVKQIVAEYLPGLENGEVSICEQEVGANGKAEMPGAKAAAGADERVVITVQKDVQLGYKVHHQVARVTLARGKMVKLAMTR